MSMQVILMERVDNLGDLGDVVKVKPGYARNYLLPQNKALRATDENVAYFESQKKEIEKQNEAKRNEAGKEAKKLDGLTVAMIRHASESGQLYGSVTARDIAEAVTEEIGTKIGRSMVTINDAFKTIGIFDVTIAPHPEVRKEIKLNIARSMDEAKIQEKTGKALIIDEEISKAEAIAKAEEKLEEASDKAKEEMLEEGAYEAEKEADEEEAKQAVQEEAAEDVAPEKVEDEDRAEEEKQAS